MKKFISLLFCFQIFLTINLCAFQKDESWKVYDDSQISVVHITMNPSSFIWMMNNPKIDSLHQCTFHFQNKYIDSSLTTVGIRLKGNTSRDAQKKSFKFSFNDFTKGGEFFDVEKLNFNGEHNDPSISRSKFCWDIYSSLGITASWAAHSALYINDQFMGVYVSTEHIGDQFLKKNFKDETGNLWKCLYPGDLTFKGSTPSSYYYSANFPAYELITNETENDYTQLARLIKIINQTSGTAFADSIEKIFYVSEYLKYHAINVLVGSWDTYYSLMNNYYLYFEPSVGKFHWLPFDYDNTFGVDWFNTDWKSANPYSYPKAVSGSRPFHDKLMANSQYKDLLTHFIDFFRKAEINVDSLNSHIDEIKNRIKTYAYLDFYKEKDYGFSNTDFDNSFSVQSNQHVKTGIKQFLIGRNSSIASQLSYIGSSPIIYNIQLSSFTPNADESVSLKIAAFGSNGIDSVIVRVSNENDVLISRLPMTFSPVSGTKIIEEADRWIGIIPPMGYNAKRKLKFYIYDSKKNLSIYPRTETVNIKTPSTIVNGIKINEFMADNETVIKDPSDEYEDWLELYNPTESPVLLTGMYLTDSKTALTKSKITIPNLIINPKEYLVFWADEDLQQTGNHADFKLSKSGEFVGLVAADGISWVDSISFGAQETDKSFGRSGNNSDLWVMMNPTPGKLNLNSTGIFNQKNTLKFEISSFPNPFNPSTEIHFKLPVNSEVTITIYDILGKELWQTKTASLETGEHAVAWNGKNKSGNQVSSGIYLCRLSFKNYSGIIKLVLKK